MQSLTKNRAISTTEIIAKPQMPNNNPNPNFHKEIKLYDAYDMLDKRLKSLKVKLAIDNRIVALQLLNERGGKIVDKTKITQYHLHPNAAIIFLPQIPTIAEIQLIHKVSTCDGICWQHESNNGEIYDFNFYCIFNLEKIFTDWQYEQFKQNKATREKIVALPDSYCSIERLNEILQAQGYSIVKNR